MNQIHAERMSRVLNLEQLLNLKAKGEMKEYRVLKAGILSMYDSVVHAQYEAVKEGNS